MVKPELARQHVNVSVNKVPDIHTFVSSLIRKVMSTDVFTQIIMKEIDRDTYCGVIKKILKSKIESKEIWKRCTTFSERLYDERLRRYPSTKKSKIYKSTLLAYGDVLEFMETYKMLRHTVAGDIIINEVANK